MIEALAAVTLLLALVAAVAAIYAVKFRDERTEAWLDLGIARGDIKSLTNRASTLRADNIALEREVGRMKAGARVEKMSAPAKMPEGAIVLNPKRDAKGRFVAKPKAAKPVKALAGATENAPISCG
jgi:hypothetical protein